MKQPKRILVIYTGGTIGMIQSSRHPYLKPVDFNNIRHLIPEVERLPCELDFFSLEPPIDSSNMAPVVWERLTRLIVENYSHYHGFVILHGTDTMAYTASALSFMLKGVHKPVILTGSQLPVDIIRTDARENLVTSLELAAHPEVTIPEVCIYFDTKLIRGNRAIKYSSEKFQAFISPNYPPLVEVGIDLEFFQANWLPDSGTFEPCLELSDTVGVLKFFPGIPQRLVEHTLQTPGIQAFILETYGTGNLPNFPWLIQILEKKIREGVILVNVTQCTAGRVMQERYEVGNDLQEIGVISGADMTTSAALAKAMYLLKLYEGDFRSVARGMTQNLVGELTQLP